VYSQQEGNQILLLKKCPIQQACLDKQTRRGFCFIGFCCPILDTELEGDYDADEKGHHELW